MSEVGITIGREEARRGGQEGATAVTLDTSTLQNEGQMGLIDAAKVRGQRVRGQTAADLVVESCGKFLTPAIELEVKKAGTVFCEQREKSMVTSPGVVGRAIEIMDVREQTGGDSFMQKSVDTIGLGSNDQQTLPMHQNLQGDTDETVVHL